MKNSTRVGAQDGLVFFTGSGVSVGYPTNLPSWNELIRLLLQGILARGIIMIPEIKNAGPKLFDRLGLGGNPEDRRIPLVYIPDFIVTYVGEAYFRMLKALFCDEKEIPPNESHRRIAALAKSGVIKAIVTTNFDTCLERALDTATCEYSVFSCDSDYQNLLADWKNEGVSRKFPVLKIHGSANHEENLIDTLAQRRIWFPESLREIFRILMKKHHWVYIGYSGADFDANPNYLCLKEYSGESVGFTWLHRKGSTPSEILRTIKEGFPEGKANFTEGELPAWLAETFDSGGNFNENSTSISDEEIASSQEKRDEFLRKTADSFLAENVPTAQCVMIIAKLLWLSGDAQQAKSLLAVLYRQFQKPWFVLLLAGKDSHASEDLVAMIAVEMGKMGASGTLGLYRRARNHYRKRNNPIGEARALSGLAETFLMTSRLDEVLSTTEMGLDLIRGKGVFELEGDLWATRGGTYSFRKQFAQALECYHRAENCFHQCGDPRGESETRNKHASVLRQMGDIPKALDEYKSAIHLLEYIDYREALGRTYNNLGNAYRYYADEFRSSGDEEESLEYYSMASDWLLKALKTKMGIGDISSCGKVHHNLASVYKVAGQTHLCKIHLEIALRIKSQVNEPTSLAETLLALGAMHLAESDYLISAKYAEQALKIFLENRLKIQSGQAMALLTAARQGLQ